MTVLGTRGLVKGRTARHLVDPDKIEFAEFIVKFFDVYPLTKWRSKLYLKAVKCLAEKERGR